MAGLRLAIRQEDLALDGLLLLVETLAEGLPLLWQDESFREEIEVLFRELVLHFPDIDRQSVLPGQFLTGRKVINFLVVVQSFVEVVLALGVGPQHVPVVTVSRNQAVYVKNEAD